MKGVIGQSAKEGIMIHIAAKGIVPLKYRNAFKIWASQWGRYLDGIWIEYGGIERHKKVHMSMRELWTEYKEEFKILEPEQNNIIISNDRDIGEGEEKFNLTVNLNLFNSLIHFKKWVDEYWRLIDKFRSKKH